MNRYLIRIVPDYKDTLNQYGTIIFDSEFIKGLVGLETDLSESELCKLPHVFRVYEDRIGSFDV